MLKESDIPELGIKCTLLYKFKTISCVKTGVGKLRPATNFCAARESLKQIIKRKLINVEEREWVHFPH